MAAASSKRRCRAGRPLGARRAWDSPGAPRKAALRWAWVGGLVAFLAAPVAADASAQQALQQLAQGRTDCRRGAYAAGIRALLDGAVALQQADPAHPENRRWLPVVRRCLGAWIRDTGRACRRRGGTAPLRTLARIEKTMRYLSAPGAKRRLRATRRRCLADAVRLGVRQCLDAPSPAGIEALRRLAADLAKGGAPAPLLRRLRRGEARCARRFVADLEARCQRAPAVGRLREMGRGVEVLSGKVRQAAQAAYERCAQSLARAAWALCRSRRYLRGRALLREAIARYGFFGARDRAFVRQARSDWLPRCGSWRIRGHVSIEARVRGAALRVRAQIDYVLARTAPGGRGLVGTLRVRHRARPMRRPDCRVLLTPQAGRYPVRGTMVGAGPQAVLRLQADPTVPAVRADEDVQIQCGRGVQVVEHLGLLDGLVRAARLRGIAIPAIPGRKRRLQFVGALPRMGRVRMSGVLTVERLDGSPGGQARP